MKRLRALRFGSTGTIGLIDHDGRSLLSPSDASLEGLSPEQMLPVQRQALESCARRPRAAAALSNTTGPVLERHPMPPWGANRLGHHLCPLGLGADHHHVQQRAGSALAG